MTDDEIRALVAQSQGPNEPMALPGSGLTGPREKISPELARERRKAMSGAMMYGASRDAIMEAFTQPPWSMSEESIIRLMAEVRKMWADEDAEASQVSRAAARRRLLSHIAEARAAKKWTAVANLEAALSKIEGTEAPEPSNGNSDDARFSDAILAMLGTKDPSQLRVMVERQRIYLDTGDLPPEPRHRPKAILSGGDTG